MPSLEKEIADANKEFMEAFRCKTPSWIARLYAPEALLMPPGHTTVVGEENICNFWQGALDSGLCDVELTTRFLDPAGEHLATEVGSYILRTEEAIADQGKYVVVWKRIDDEWRLYRDIWNSDPKPEPASDKA